MSKIKIFFAYQFSGARLNRIDREAKYTAALEDVNSALASDGRALKLEWEYWNISSGTPLSKEIFDRMDAADVYVFDLSDDNHNVYIELGYALAICRANKKEIVLILHEDNSISGVPTDISGIFVLRVNETTLQQKLTAELYAKAKRVPTIGRAVNQLLSDGLKSGAHIVCPEIPKDLRSRFADHIEPNYLRYVKFADLDTLFYLRERLARLCPNIEVLEFTGEEYYQDNDALQIIVGGPAWNRMARVAQRNLPLQFEDGGDGNDDPVVEGGASRTSVFTPDVSGGSLLADVSYVGRLSRGPGRRAILLSGCRTFGVLGAAKSLFDENVAAGNLEWLDRNAGDSDFVMAFKSAVVSGSTIAENFNRSDILALYVKYDRAFGKVTTFK